MTEPTLRPTPLASLAGRMEAGSGAAAALREIPFVGQIELRGNPADSRFLEAVRLAAGLDLPSIPNTVRRNGDRAALWLGPDAWLLVLAEPDESPVAAGLRAGLAGLHVSVVETGAGRLVLELAGPRTREVLLKGCSLDLHPRAFAPGRCAQTNLARTQVLLHQIDGGPTYRLFLRPSYGPYLVEWLLDAMAEYRQT